MTPEAVAQMRKWLDDLAMQAYGMNEVDDPSDHEGSKASDMLTTLAAENATLRGQRDRSLDLLGKSQDRECAKDDQLDAARSDLIGANLTIATLRAEADRTADKIVTAVAALEALRLGVAQMLADMDADYNRKTNNLIARAASLVRQYDEMRADSKYRSATTALKTVGLLILRDLATPPTTQGYVEGLEAAKAAIAALPYNGNEAGHEDAYRAVEALAARPTAHSAGYMEGLEAAAKYHDEQAAKLQEIADKYPQTRIPEYRYSVENHRTAARVIRGLAARPDPQPSVVCPECDDTGVRDSGGVHPWGEPIMLPCDHNESPALAVMAMRTAAEAIVRDHQIMNGDGPATLAPRREGAIDALPYADAIAALPLDFTDAELLAAAAIEDIRTHRMNWKRAMEIVRDGCPLPTEDQDDRSYWEHQIRSLDKAADALVPFARKGA